jgi:hypothetical protein
MVTIHSPGFAARLGDAVLDVLDQAHRAERRKMRRSASRSIWAWP